MAQKSYSLRLKLVVLLVSTVLLAAGAIATLTLLSTKSMATQLVDHGLRSKVEGDVASFHRYVEILHPGLHLRDGDLVDIEERSPAHDHHLVDTVSSELQVVATVFIPDQNDFRRLSTNIRLDDGSRAIGTMLGSASDAFSSVSRGERYIGYASILGQSYLTAYDPVLSQDGEVMAVFFLGIPKKEADAIAMDGFLSALYSSVVGVIVVVVAVVLIAIVFASGMSRGIASIAASLGSSADEVSRAATGVSEASNQMASGASEQAASLQETCASLEEIAASTRQTADNTTSAEKQSATITQQLLSSHEDMQQLQNSMDKIQEASQRMATIIKTIDEIAFQTNLLALNAAVEAARAGEAGKGFSVVAEEVRSLAQRSAEAARSTSEMITENSQHAQQGVTVVGDISGILQSLSNDIQGLSGVIAEVSSAASEQARGIEQINIAANQLDQVTQANAASAEQGSSSATEMQAQAEQLRAVVQRLNNIVQGSRVSSSS